MGKGLKKMILGSLVALALGIEVNLPKKQEIPYIRRGNAIFLRLPQIPVDVNRLDDAEYLALLQEESLKCMKNPDYDSPYAKDYLIEFVGFEQTLIDRLVSGSKDYWRKLIENESNNKEDVAGVDFLAP